MTQAPGAIPTPSVLDYERTLILGIELSNTMAAQIPGLPGAKAKRSIEPTPEAGHMTASDLCPLTKKALACRGPSTHEAASFTLLLKVASRI